MFQEKNMIKMFKIGIFCIVFFAFFSNIAIIHPALAEQNVISRRTDGNKIASGAIAYSDGGAKSSFSEGKNGQKTEQAGWWRSRFESVKSVIYGAVNMVKNIFMITKGEVNGEHDNLLDNASVGKETESEDVVKPAGKDAPSSESAAETSAKEPEAIWGAKLVSQNKIIKIEAGGTAELFAAYKNSGSQNFTSQNVFLNIYSFNTADFFNSSWITEKRPALISGGIVEPGKIAEFRFEIKAPKGVGNYAIAFRPVYQTDNNFKWLGSDVARWQFDVVGNETQEQENTKTQEHENTKTQEHENNELNIPPFRKGGQGGFNPLADETETQKHESAKTQEQETKITRNFVWGGGDGTPPEKIILTFPSEFFYLTNQRNIILQGKKAQDASQIDIYLNNNNPIILKDFVDESTWQYGIELFEGENKIIFIAEDVSKNRSESVVLDIVSDATPPPSPVIATNGGDDFTTGWPTVILSGTKASDAGFVFANDEEAEIIDENNWRIELNLNEGENLIQILAKDLAGNSSDIVNLKIIRDSSLLIIHFTETPPAITNQPVVNFAFNAGAEVENFYCKLDSGEEAVCVSPFLVENLSQGAHQFNLRVDSDQISPIHYQWSVDLTPPACEVDDLNSEQQTEKFNLIISSSDNFGIASWDVEYQVDGGEWRVLVDDSTESMIEFTGADKKTYGFRCQSEDLAHNLSVVKDDPDTATTVNLPPAVVINELMWMGSTLSTDDEWIELKNTTSQEIDLNGWQITKFSGGKEVLMITIENKSIPANGYFLIANYNWNNAKSILSVEPDLVDTDVSLVNTKLQIKLYNGDWTNIDNLIDTADDGIGVPLAGEHDKYYSMERNNIPGDGTQKENWHTCSQAVNLIEGAVECGTPRAQNSVSP